MFYRINPWFAALPEAFGPLLAQAETVYEKASQAADKFGNANDSVRLGMALVALFIVTGVPAWLYFTSQRLSVKKLEDRNAELEKEIRANRVSYETKYDALRADCEKKCEAYLGTMNLAVNEFKQARLVLHDAGLIRRGEDHPPVHIPPSVQPLPSKANFLPRRSIPKRTDNEDT